MKIKDKLKGLFRDELPTLPELFMFGVATADHQCEAYDPQYEDIRDKWEAMPIHNPKAARNKATDFWNRYAEDIDLAAKLGCKAFRFSISWSRVEPKPGEFDPLAFDHYQKLIDKILSYDMKPILTLHHFTWPIHVEVNGGMTGNAFPEIYAKYTKEVAKHFADQVPYWITFNEPNLLMGGYVKPWWDAEYAAPPGLPEGTTTDEQVEAVRKLMRNLFLANKKAYEIIKMENPNAQVGANSYIYGLPGWILQLVNRNVSAIKSDRDLQRQVDRLDLKRDLIRGERISRIRAIVLEKKKVDVVLAAVTKTEENNMKVMFSEPYFITHTVLLIKEDHNAADVRDLVGKEIAVVRGSTLEQNFPALLSTSQTKIYDDYEAAREAIDLDQASALIGDDALLSGLMAQHPGRYRLLKDHFNEARIYAAAVAQGDSRLLDTVNCVIREFKASPEAALWKDKYEETRGLRIEHPPRTARALVLNKLWIEAADSREKACLEPIPKAPVGTVLRRIQDRGFIVVAIREDLPGFGYINPETGELSGLEILFARRLSQKIFGDPSKICFQPAALQNRIAPLELRLGLIDWIQKQYAILSTMLMANWWYMGMADELDDYLCPIGCERKMDFIGLDYYWGISSLHIERLQRLIDAAYRRFDQAPVYPGALYNILVDLQKKFPSYPLIIFENGSVKVADGWERTKYIQEHIRQVQRAAKEGMKVEGYICWSVTSNREWDLEFNDASDFGLYHIDLDSDPALIRKRTSAADAFEQMIKNRSS